MCQPSIYSWPLLWWPLYLHGAATATALMWSGGARPLSARPLSSPLLTLHVSTLRPNPSAERRPRYVMRGGPLRLVKSA